MMNTFNKLLSEFEKSKLDFYRPFYDKFGCPNIHLPVPVLDADDNYCLKAIIYHLRGGRFLSQPYQTMLVCNQTTEYTMLGDNANLVDWRGPLYNTAFEELEARLLLISEEVFESYCLRVSNSVVEEYARGFFKITPPEYVIYYEQIAQDFIEWLRIKL